jgi:Cellulase (glycosyl hydrolase family 5)
MADPCVKHAGRTCLGVVAVTLLALTVIVPFRMTSVHAASFTPPTQWIAKMFTEAWGRAPTTGDWNFWLAYYTSNPCNVGTLSTLGSAIYTNSTFLNAYPEATSKPQRVTALVRGVYSHDPNSNDWSAYYTPYASGTNSWAQTVGNIFNNGVFGALVVPAVCGASPDYGFGYSRPLDILAGGSRSESTLQSQLNAAQSTCGTVALAQTELVRVGNTQALTVPRCVTLTTAGAPPPSAYASMARIVPDGLTCVVYWCNHEAIVVLGKGARLQNVWVDGGGTDPSQFQVANVETRDLAGSDGTQITSSRLTDPGPNGTAIRLDGFGTTGVPCDNVTVSGNLITGYAGHHAQDSMGRAEWASGISDLCEHATISSNQLVDLSDRGITISGERYRIPGPPLPPVATAAAGSSNFGAGSYSVIYTYHYSSPFAAQSGGSPAASVTLTAGQQIGVAAISGIPSSVASLTFYVAQPFVTPYAQGPTVPVSSGSAAAFSITSAPIGPAPPRWDQTSVPATQRSQVSGNTIVSAGNSAFAALAADPIGECSTPFAHPNVVQSLVPTTCMDLPDKKQAGSGSPPPTAWDPRDFTGSSVDGNTFTTGPRTAFFVGLLVGSWSLWGSAGPLGSGASFTNNTVGLTPTRVNMAIDTDGMLNVNLKGNTTAASSYSLVDGNPGIVDSKCPQQVWGYNPFTASFVSGSDVPPQASTAWLDCMAPSPSAAMDQISVGSGSANLTFVGSSSGVRFSPFGTNYAAGNGGVLAPSHATLVQDFRTMRHAGFNMIRTFLEFSDFVDPPSSGHPDGTPNAANLATLGSIVSLAARSGLYVDVTGLFESDPAHMPAWYDALTANGGETHGRWQAQQVFWAAVANQLKGATNVLDYDLMNEPAVPSGTTSSWNIGCQFGPCYVQYITLNQNGRAATDITTSWISAMTSAIRGTGDTHLVTVGLLPFGKGSPFDPATIAPLLSYLSVHEYPNPGVSGVDAALANASQFQQGKPLVIEEWYPLNNADGFEMSDFINNSARAANGSATGWVGQWPGCSFHQLNDPPGGCGDTVGLGAVFGGVVVTVTDQSRQPLAFAEP